MDIELIIKDKRRLAVMNDLSVEEPITLHRLAAKNRIPETMMGRVLQSMEESGIVKLKGKEYWLTDTGQDLIRELRRIEKVSPSSTPAPRQSAQVRIAPDHKRKQIDRRRVP